jgi:hypothetical protein
MEIRELVELAGHAAEIAGVALIVGGIVQTVTLTPTMDSVLALAMIVAIRTFLSWSLALELDGRWPWQRADERPAPEPAPQPRS